MKDKFSNWLNNQLLAGNPSASTHLVWRLEFLEREVARLRERTRPHDRSTRMSEPRPDKTDELLDEMFADRTDLRLDACIGEVVRILVNADRATFAKIYAMAKTEQAAQNERSRQDINLRLRRHRESIPGTTLDVIGTTGGKATVEQKG